MQGVWHACQAQAAGGISCAMLPCPAPRCMLQGRGKQGSELGATRPTWLVELLAVRKGVAQAQVGRALGQPVPGRVGPNHQQGRQVRRIGSQQAQQAQHVVCSGRAGGAAGKAGGRMGWRALAGGCRPSPGCSKESPAGEQSPGKRWWRAEDGKGREGALRAQLPARLPAWRWESQTQASAAASCAALRCPYSRAIWPRQPSPQSSSRPCPQSSLQGRRRKGGFVVGCVQSSVKLLRGSARLPQVLK